MVALEVRISEARKNLLSVCDIPLLKPSALPSFPIVRGAFLSPIARTNNATSTMAALSFFKVSARLGAGPRLIKD